MVATSIVINGSTVYKGSMDAVFVGCCLLIAILKLEGGV